MDISKLTYRPCVGLMVVNAQGQIWVGRRVPATDKKEPGGWWQMPQGGIDEGETPAAAALRELHEETGIRSARILGWNEREGDRAQGDGESRTNQVHPPDPRAGLAAPPAARLNLPTANPTYSLTASLAITFPFNVTLGIPIYYWFAQLLHGR